MANGGASAVEDAEVLSLCVAHFGLGGVPAATAAYERLRNPRVERIQQMAREINTFLEGSEADDDDGARERQAAMKAKLAETRAVLDRGGPLERARPNKVAPWSTPE